MRSAATAHAKSNRRSAKTEPDTESAIDSHPAPDFPRSPRGDGHGKLKTPERPFSSAELRVQTQSPSPQPRRQDYAKSDGKSKTIPVDVASSALSSQRWFKGHQYGDRH